ncbi:MULTISPECIES: PH domain-containing protein [unclassified Streptomyces]|uniref:PH domain-containing protein n=1 Tax=unclassified Streptomyces TaxID=2593676 RepID=UPI001654F4EF|nr:PH domain-containing protein [Streptomyces sp. CB02980]MCB8903589.1 PH domain-containing protein [Streptomyces sp. CB02980]
MPLPFLTADRAFDTTDHVALPFDDHDQWRRPYRPGSWRVGAAALALLLASFVLLAAVIITAAGGFSGGAVTLATAVLVILAALRMLRMGTWVSRAGIRRVAFFSTVTVPWAKVTSVRTVQQPVRWLGLPRTVQGQALALGRQGGEQLMLLTDHNADFLSRVEAFDRAADTVEAWNAEYGVAPAVTR